MPNKESPERSELFQPGQSFGKFYLVQLIGEGGTSRIFKALQQPINRLVALKIPTFPMTGAILSPDEFLTEATLMARLDHPNVIRIHDFGVHEDSAFICMEYVEGLNLQEWTVARGPMSLSAALAAGRQTLDGLRHSHSHGVLHLDLSPANVLIAKSGTVKLSDFGMAGKKRAAGGEIVGTPAFLSPEHVAGTAGTPQSDLFSFASLLFHAATGEPLFDPGEDRGRMGEVLREIAAARDNPPLDRLRRIPGSLAKVAVMALQGSDAEAVSGELMSAWKNVEGDATPEAVLRREQEGGSQYPDNPTDAGFPSEKEMRVRYQELRESGRHREAVALLERAIKLQPDNTVVRELLATPPAKGKATAVTVAVGNGSTPPGDANRASARATLGGESRKRTVRNLAAASMGILTVTLGVLAWHQGRNPDAPLRSETAVEKKEPEPAPVPKPGAPADKDGFAAEPPAGSKSRSGAGAAGAKAAGAGMKKPKRSDPLSPAMVLRGPPGTRVTVDDTAEWFSPGPKGGWTLSPGLINITLAPPGKHPPISSSLFVSADTLYVLSLEEDGGFSVSRHKR